MSGKPGCGATNLATAQRIATEQRVFKAIEEQGGATIAKIIGLTGLSKSTIENAIKRLRMDGLVKAVGRQKQPGRWSHPPTIYGVGQEEHAPLHKGAVKITVRRHPMDVALFGEYRRAA